jgi:Zn-dependent peptidase ImmA (M78 family)
VAYFSLLLAQCFLKNEKVGSFMPNGAVSQTGMDIKDLVFARIKDNVDKLLLYVKGDCYSENPFVDIKTIARKIGIYDILTVPPELISNEHAKLTEIIINADGEAEPLKKPVILVSKLDSNEEKHFSIAHEIYHFMEADTSGAFRINDEFRIKCEKPLKDLKKQPLDTFEIVSEGDKKAVAKRIAGIVSDVLEKPVTEKKAQAIFEKAVKPIYEKLGKTVSEKFYDISLKKQEAFEREWKKTMFEAAKETLKEEIADYFAANLIVPTERFILWEDKPDEAIAQAFNVPLGCIQKRREEIENELYLISLPKEHTLSRKLRVSRGNVVGIGKVKIPSTPILNHNIKWFSFLDIQESENSFVSTCINLRIDGYGETKEEAENDMFESMIYFLYQNFNKLSSKYARENINELYESDDWSKELWDVYHKAQVQLINRIELKTTKLKNLECQVNERETDIRKLTDDMIRKIRNGLSLQKTYLR